MRIALQACLALVLLGACRQAEAPAMLSPEARELLWAFQEASEHEQFVRALALLDSTIVLAPANPRLHFLRGDMLSTLYRFKEAEAAFTRALALDPRYPTAAYRLGNNAFFLGQNRAALSYYFQEQKALGAHADSVSSSAVWAQIGRVYARLGVSDSARIAYERAIGNDSANDQAWGWMSELAEEEGRFEEALAAAERASALDPDHPDYQYRMGALHYRMGNLKAAVAPLRAAIAAQPWHTGAHYNLGRTLIALGRTAEGAPLLDATDSLQALASDIVLARYAAQHTPEGQDEWIVLALLYEQAGQLDEARQAFRIARQLMSTSQ